MTKPHKHRMVRRHPDNISFAHLRDRSRRRGLPRALRAPALPRRARLPLVRRLRARLPLRPPPLPAGLYTCGTCRKQFSLTSGTAMHRSKLSLSQWLRAIWLAVSSSKGISANKLGEMLDVTYNTHQTPERTGLPFRCRNPGLGALLLDKTDQPDQPCLRAIIRVFGC